MVDRRAALVRHRHPGDTPEIAARFDAAHTAWLAAVKANRLPSARYTRSLHSALAQGRPSLAAAEAAWALPGVAEAGTAEEDAYIAVSDLALAIQARPVASLDDLALVAKATSVLVWLNGRFEADARLGEDEDLDKSAVRSLIEACFAIFSGDAASAVGKGAGADEPLWSVIDAHRRAYKAFGDAVVAADPVAVRQAGGDTSETALATLTTAKLAASDAERQAWRDLFKTRPNTLVGILQLLRYTAKHYEENMETIDGPDVFGALIGAAEGLRFASLSRPAEYDLSLLSVSELEQLARIASRERETLMAVENQGFCWRNDRKEYSPIGKIIEAEGERMSFLGEYAVREIERRRPADKDDINLRLEALVRHHLTCNGYIEPDLMTEVVQAWGRA